MLFNGRVIFDNNNSTSSASNNNNNRVISGALYLLSLSQIRLDDGTYITFVNNTGR